MCLTRWQTGDFSFVVGVITRPCITDRHVPRQQSWTEFHAIYSTCRRAAQNFHFFFFSEANRRLWLYIRSTFIKLNAVKDTKPFWKKNRLFLNYTYVSFWSPFFSPADGEKESSFRSRSLMWEWSLRRSVWQRRNHHLCIAKGLTSLRPSFPIRRATWNTFTPIEMEKMQFYVYTQSLNETI